MAHECPECGHYCHCNGDIDDILMESDKYCSCCENDFDDDYQDIDDDYLELLQTSEEK